MAGLGVAILAFPAKADALGPVDIQIGARARVAAGNLGRLGFGLGGRAGVSIQDLYAGLDVIDSLGAIGPCDTCSSPAGQTVSPSRRALLYFVGADVGALVLPAQPSSALTVRGQIGVTF